jgi:hypothetical protein
MRTVKKVFRSSLICLFALVVCFYSSNISLAMSRSALESVVNGRPWYDATQDCSIASSPVVSGNNPAQAFAFFRANELSPEQAAAMVGNFMRESGETIDTHAGEGGSHQGIAQWDSGRWKSFIEWAGNKDIWALTTQLEWSWEELSNGAYKPVLVELKQQTTIPAAVKIVLDKYEVAPGQAEDDRVRFAEDVLKKYGNTTTGTLAGTAGVNGPDVNPLVRFKYGSGPRLKTALPNGANVTREDWAKLFLKFIAVGAGKPETEVITDEKVLAVVGWQMAEGGSTATPGSYNGLNVAKDAAKYQADLNPVYNHVYADGNQHPAFKSVEEGVESNVRFVEKDHYSRLHEMLLNPLMNDDTPFTADKFVENFDNLTYNGATVQSRWAAGGYLTLFKDTVAGLRGSNKQERYDEPMLGPEAKAALKDMGVTPDEKVTPLDINSVSAGGSVNCSGGQAVRVGNLVFPLRVTKSALESSLGSCLDKTGSKICIAGHNYTAYDLFSPEGTEVVAATDGKVVSAKISNCGHGFGSALSVQVFNEQENRTYFYQHMSDTSGKVSKDQTIKAGDSIGTVGGEEADCKTSPHLHFDAVTGDSRPACSRLSCSAENKKLFIDIGAELYTAYTGLQ